MKIAIMQPYVFPYLGYYQLVSAVDTFVFFDDVNFINKGWINRNYILQQDQPCRFTIPLVKASQNKLINEINLSDYESWQKDFLKMTELCYRKAPHYNFIFNWLSDLLSNKKYSFIAELACESVQSVSNLLELNTKFLLSSSINYKTEDYQDGPAKILAICKLLNADSYINASNGKDLYDSELFNSKNINLNFINMDDISYKQLKSVNFTPSLSILDVLMFNSLEETKILLEKYKLS